MVPPALWSRLRALDARCDFEFRRTDANADRLGNTSRLNYDRKWTVVMRERANPESAVTSFAGDLAMALEAAVAMAESKGWARYSVTTPVGSQGTVSP